MAREHESRLIVSLLDRVTGPARKVAGAMRGLGRDLTQFKQGGSVVGTRLEAAMARNEAALGRARMGIADTVASYYTLRAAIAAPIRAAANFETILEDIGQKAGVPVERLAALGDRIQSVARDTNQGASQIAQAVDALAGRGASLDVAMAAADPIGRAAVAYRAATEDLAAASWSAVDNLKVPADQIERALDAMAQSGKEGAFELRDMATYFPALGAAYQGLGQEGVGAVADLAAALQVVRKGTGDASSAATNLQNVLQKVYAPATVKKFADAGVDVFAEMEAAAQRGLTPIEAIAELTDRTLQGDLSRMGNLFEDAQVQAGLRSLIQGMEEYRRIRAEAMGADGVVDADYQRRIRTADGVMKRWNATTERLSITIGNALLPVLNDVLDTIEPVIDRMAEFVSAHPQLAAGLMTSVGGLIAFRGALAGLRFVGLLGQSGALNLAHLALGRIGGTAAGIGAAGRASVALQTALAGMQGASLTRWDRMGAAMRGMAGATPGLRLATPAVTGIVGAIGAISAPSWVGIAAAVAAVGAAWRYWDRIAAIADGVSTAIGERLAPVMRRVREWAEPLTPILNRLDEAWAPISKGIDDAANAVRSFGGNLFSREILTDAEVAQISARAANVTRNIIAKMDEIAAGVRAKAGGIYEAGAALVQSLWDGMESKFAALLARVTSMADQIGAKWRGILSGGRSDVPDLGAYNPETGYGSPVDGARAKGGHVSAGGDYLVGEHGPEIITPTKSSYVHPSGSGGGMSIGSVTINPTLTFPGATAADADHIAREVMRRLQSDAAAALRGAFADLQVG